VLSRRGFLLGTGAAAVLAACGGDDGDADGGGTTGSTAGPGGSTTTAAGGLVLGEAFNRNTLLVAGIEQRAPFVLFESSGGLVALDDAPETVSFTLTPESGAPLAAVAVARHGQDVERPYYPLRATIPAPGIWTVDADLGDGTVLQSSVQVNESGSVPQIGEALPVAPTPTEADALGVGTICTQTPTCDFHTASLDDAVAAGGPIAVLLSTPAYCQVGICGPVLDLLTTASRTRSGLTVVHVEVYPNAEAGEIGDPSPIVEDTFGLDYEPALFVASGATITARLDNIYDGAELADALASAGA
jgi:hypothetical protein